MIHSANLGFCQHFTLPFSAGFVVVNLLARPNCSFTIFVRCYCQIGVSTCIDCIFFSLLLRIMISISIGIRIGGVRSRCFISSSIPVNGSRNNQSLPKADSLNALSLAVGSILLCFGGEKSSQVHDEPHKNHPFPSNLRFCKRIKNNFNGTKLIAIFAI